MREHQWRLVGPWYRWNSDQEDPGRGRSSRPIIQKYADSNHVVEFLRNPQHSLRYLDEDISSAGKRKVFLDTHSRFYLIVCELHCDMPGFPKVTRDQVCEAGFIVRKRRTEVPDSARPEVETLLQSMAYERARLQRIEARKEKLSPGVGAMPVTGLLQQALNSGRMGAEIKFRNRLDKSREALNKLLGGHVIERVVQGWMSTGPGLGHWQDLPEELPEEVDEQIFPLYPLIPNDEDEQHASGHKTIWYGLMPVGSSDSDSAGNPQFDDRAIYEVRCFVRRHQPHCPKTIERNDCKGEIVWSQPTESYQLASHFDLLGTSNRLTTVQAPDLKLLAEQVSSPDFKMGQGLGFAVATPADSGLPIDMDADGNPKSGSPGGLPSICFFAIPLITIVAFFLLRLFLPIVVFLFGLWFLLRLKLCILPQISIDLGLELELGLEGELALEADLGVSVKAKLDVMLGGLAEGTRDYFNGEISAGGDRMEQAYRDLARMAIDQSTDFSDSGVAPELLQEIEDMIAADATLEYPNTSGTGQLPNPADRLTYYTPRRLEEVFA